MCSHQEEQIASLRLQLGGTYHPHSSSPSSSSPSSSSPSPLTYYSGSTHTSEEERRRRKEEGERKEEGGRRREKRGEGREEGERREKGGRRREKRGEGREESVVEGELTHPLDRARRNTQQFHRHLALPPTTLSSSSSTVKNIPFTVTTSCATTATVTLVTTGKVPPMATVAIVTTTGTATSVKPLMTSPSCCLHGNGLGSRVGYPTVSHSQYWVPPTGRGGRICFKSPQSPTPPFPPAAPLPPQDQFSYYPQDQLSSSVSTRHPGDKCFPFRTPCPPRDKCLPSTNLSPQMPVPSTLAPLPPRGNDEPQSLGVDLNQLVREVQGKLCTILDTPA